MIIIIRSNNKHLNINFEIVWKQWKSWKYIVFNFSHENIPMTPVAMDREHQLGLRNNAVDGWNVLFWAIKSMSFIPIGFAMQLQTLFSRFSRYWCRSLIPKEYFQLTDVFRIMNEVVIALQREKVICYNILPSNGAR